MTGSAVIEKLGETPLQALERYRVRANIGADVPMTYAGRLDPMADGLLLILIGEECKKRDTYDSLDKEYEFEVLFGAWTDTGDILGLVASAPAVPFDGSTLASLAASFTREVSLPYPAFSSKTVRGTPLFQYALEGRLSEIEIPSARVRIRDMQYLDERKRSSVELRDHIEARIAQLETDPNDPRLGSDFRKAAVLERWREVLRVEREWQSARFKASVSAGTYIRSLAPKMGEALKTRALALSIRRTRIGARMSAE